MPLIKPYPEYKWRWFWYMIFYGTKAPSGYTQEDRNMQMPEHTTGSYNVGFGSDIDSMAEERELSTREVAKEIGVSVDLLRKWKHRGFLKLAPQGVAGQGRSVECHWSSAALQEARAWANSPRPAGCNVRYSSSPVEETKP